MQGAQRRSFLGCGTGEDVFSQLDVTEMRVIGLFVWACSQDTGHSNLCLEVKYTSSHFSYLFLILRI